METMQAKIYLYDGHTKAFIEDFEFTKITELHVRLREHQKPYFGVDERGMIDESQTANGTRLCECHSETTNYSHLAVINQEP